MLFLRTFGCGVFCEIGVRPQDEQDDGLDIGENADYTNHVGNLNPIRYRGYYFDSETGLYFLHARYYDPTVCRFISRDDFSYLDPDTVNGINLFAYCLNNPVMNTDPTGHSVSFVIALLVVGAIAGGAVGGAIAYGEATAKGKTGSDLIWSTIGGVVVGAAFGAAATGAVISTIGVVGGALGATTVMFGVPTAQAFAIGALAYNFAAIFVAPFLGIEMEPIELAPSSAEQSQPNLDIPQNWPYRKK